MQIQNKFLTIIFILMSISTSFGQQLIEQTMMYDNEIRTYTIYVPEFYEDEDVPLLFSFHGGGGDIASQISLDNMSAIADTAGFIIVYPQARPDPSDGGSANWLHKEPTDVDDVFFIEALIEIISDQYEIDESRIYACGYSLGGEFTYELVCRLNEQIAAVGVVARTMGLNAFENCAPVHPTGMLTILGTDDFISPYDGLVFGGIQYYLPADDVHNYWVNHNNTAPNPTIIPLPNTNSSDGSTVERHIWADGDGCVNVEHLKVIGGGHDWPGTFGNMDINASVEIWNYVSNYDLNGLIECETSSNNYLDVIQSKITVFPNPVKDIATIELDVFQNQTYQIYSIAGERLLSNRISSSQTIIDLSSLPASIYFVKVRDQIQKFIKVE